MCTAAALSASSVSQLQQQFNALLPEMQRAISFHLGRLPRRDRDEFETDVLAASWLAWVGLARRGRDPVVVGPAAIVGNSVRYVLNGRMFGTGCRKRGMDVYRAHRKSRVQLTSLDHREDGQRWRELLLSDGRFDPAIQAALRVDLDAWLATLTPRKRAAALLLAQGYETGLAAKELGVTAPAISIARVALEQSWRTFQGEAGGSVATARAERKGRTRATRRDARTTSAAPQLASAS